MANIASACAHHFQAAHKPLRNLPRLLALLWLWLWDADVELDLLSANQQAMALPFIFQRLATDS